MNYKVGIIKSVDDDKNKLIVQINYDFKYAYLHQRGSLIENENLIDSCEQWDFSLIKKSFQSSREIR